MIETLYKFGVYNTPEGITYTEIVEYEAESSMFDFSLNGIVLLDIVALNCKSIISRDKDRLLCFLGGMAYYAQIKNKFFQNTGDEDMPQGIYGINKEGKLEPRFVYCKMCNSPMEVKSYTSKGVEKKYSFCPKCDGEHEE